ncbi:MAG: DUF1223 domain-containing protein [Roseovarius sp.]
MRQIITQLALMIAMALPIGAVAQDRPVVIELFTSQGCSSCPPADAYLHKLAKRENVIALAMHVDYWDYIGWKDIFASPAMTERQRSYARTGNRRMVYTPQMIINGQDHVVGNRPKDVEDLIARHAKLEAVINLTAARTGNSVIVNAAPLSKVKGPVTVQLIRYKPTETVNIKRGENAGKSLSYANIVTEIDVLRDWDGRDPLSITANMAGAQPGVILIQGQNLGGVIAAVTVE